MFSAAAPALQLRTLLHTKTICLEQSSVKDLFNFSTMIVGESNPPLSSLVEENERCSKKIAELEQMIAEARKRRQQYNGGTFIGNHVHKSLQDQHTHTLCSSLIVSALKHSPQLVEEALLCVRSKTAFSLFS
ncbi:hypothetical protein EMCRGX_G026336 [Ephydatia muelleri]